MKPAAPIGLAYGILSALLMVLLGYLVHWNPRSFPTEELIFIRCTFSFLILLPFCFLDLKKYFSANSKFLWMRTIFGSFGLFFLFHILRVSELSTTNLIYSITPFFVLLLCTQITKEKINQLEFTGVVVVIAGNIIFFSQQETINSAWIWICGMGGSIVMAINYIALGKCAKEYSAPLVSIGIFALGIIISILIKGIYSSSTWITPQGSDLFYLAAVIVLGVNGQLFLVRSFTYLKTPVLLELPFHLFYLVGY